MNQFVTCCLCGLLLVSAGVGMAQETGDPSVDQLRKRISSGTSEERVEAIEAVGRRGAQASSAVDELIAALGDKDRLVRYAAATALGEIGPAAKRAVPALIERFTDVETNHQDIPVWNAAAESVGKLGAEPLPELIKMLSGDDRVRCHAAAVAISRLGAAAQPAVDAAIEQLKKDDPETRVAMIYALMGIGPGAREAVPVLIQMLGKSEDFHVQYWACRALGKIGLPAARPAVPELIALLKNPVASVRGNAAAALGNLGPEVGPAVVPHLSAALRDKLYNVRRSAAIALGQLGPGAAEAVPALDDALANPGFAARSHAAIARWRITGEVEPTIKVLLVELDGRDEPWDAAEGFATLGAKGSPAIERLVKLLESPNSETRLFAASSLAGIGAAAKSSLPALRKLLQDPDNDVREVAKEAIQKIETAPQ